MRIQCAYDGASDSVAGCCPGSTSDPSAAAAIAASATMLHANPMCLRLTTSEPLTLWRAAALGAPQTPQQRQPWQPLSGKQTEFGEIGSPGPGTTKRLQTTPNSAAQRRRCRQGVPAPTLADLASRTRARSQSESDPDTAKNKQQQCFMRIQGIQCAYDSRLRSL